MVARDNWVTRNIPGVVEYLSGDPNAPGYDPHGHGGGNYHDHFGFADRATLERARAALERHGVQVTRVDVQSGHSPNSMHYGKPGEGKAFDVPGAQWGKGTDAEVFAGSRKVRQILLDEFGGGKGGGRVYDTVGGASSATQQSPESQAMQDAITQSFAQLQQSQNLLSQMVSGTGLTLNRPGASISTPQATPQVQGVHPSFRGALGGTQVASLRPSSRVFNTDDALVRALLS